MLESRGAASRTTESSGIFERTFCGPGRNASSERRVHDLYIVLIPRPRSSPRIHMRAATHRAYRIKRSAAAWQRYLNPSAAKHAGARRGPPRTRKRRAEMTIRPAVSHLADSRFVERT